MIPSRRALVPLLSAGAACAAAFAPVPPSWIESAYSQRAYLRFERLMTPLTNQVPIAVTDLLLAAVAIAVVVAAAWAWRLRRRVGSRAALLRAAGTAVTVAAIGYVAFVAAWGLNYRRMPLTARLDFERARVTPGSVGRLARQLVDRVNALHAPVHSGEWPEWDELPAILGPAFDAVQRQLAPLPSTAVPGTPKWSVLTFYFERAGVSGMTNPFALEVVVDYGQLPFERPFVAAHEWAHLAGYADESEANFIGWLVCFQGPAVAEYSADLVLLMYALGGVPDGERAEITRMIGEGPRRDLIEIRRRAAAAWPWLERPAWWLYDRYLRANRVEQGVMSYSAALQLVAGTRFEPAWVPARRVP